jgi:endonuclease/exonuclease/phosphatase family metal-dependent hydrolase
MLQALGRKITVMSFNIQHGLGMDHKIDIRRIANVILKIGTQLVGMQEVDKFTLRNPIDQTKVITKLTETEGVFGKAIDDFGGEYGNAILSKAKILDTRHLIFKTITDPTAERRSVIATLVTLEKETKMWFASTHLDFRKNEALLQQCLELLEFLRNLQKETPDTPMVLVGDFNCTPEDDVIKRIKEEYVDAWEVAGKGKGYTHPSNRPDKRIDYIFVSKHWKVESCGTFASEASDHAALFASLSL